jgi:hypothetical protein
MPFKARITRRTFVVAAGAFLSLPAVRLNAESSDGAVSIAENAYIWGFPLVLTNRYRTLAGAYPINQFTLSTRLSSPEDKVAGPNVDTLYGFSFLDVSKEPLILHVPDTNDRYYSIHLIDAYQNSFAYVGRRATGTREAEYAITAPGWAGQLPVGVTKIESPTPHLLALTRTLVRSEQDLPTAQSVQLQYTLRTLSAYTSPAAAPRTTSAAFNVFPFLNLSSSGERIFEELNTALSVDPPSAHEKAPFEQFATIGIRTGKQSVKAAAPSALQQAATQADRRIAEADYSTDVNGWKVNYHITNFIEDPLLRASVNRIGPGAHIAQEALYFAAKADHEGKPLSGENRYRIRFPESGLPPVDAFWSLILYGSDFALVRNPLQRYSISDRTQGLVRNSDGSLDILIQSEAPASGTSNWLPAPGGNFILILRTYEPRPELFNGNYKVPIIQRS